MSQIFLFGIPSMSLSLQDSRKQSVLRTDHTYKKYVQTYQSPGPLFQGSSPSLQWHQTCNSLLGLIYPHRFAQTAPDDPKLLVICPLLLALASSVPRLSLLACCQPSGPFSSGTTEVVETSFRSDLEYMLIMCLPCHHRRQ